MVEHFTVYHTKVQYVHLGLLMTEPLDTKPVLIKGLPRNTLQAQSQEA